VRGVPGENDPVIHHRFVLPSRLGEPIRGDLRFLEGAGRRPVVAVCHGFKGFKDWGFHPWLGERLAGAGFVAVHFNFSRNGIGEDLLEFTELERFRRNTYSTELDDLASVLAALSTAFPDTPLDLTRLGLLGHSRGGAIAVLGAAANPDVKALVTWAGVSTLERVTDAPTLALWRRDGYMESLNTRTGQPMRVGVELLDDFLANRERLDVRRAVSRLGCPYRIVHGTADEAVPFQEAESLLAYAEGRAGVDLVPIEGAGHTFGAAHPFAGATDALEKAFEATSAHFTRHLST